MKISVDAMGGDFAPEEIVKGAVLGAKEHGVGVVLVGPETTIKEELKKQETSGLDIEIIHTDEYLSEGENPAYVMRKKRNASIMLAVKMVKEGKASAVVGAGPTGGIFAAAMQVLDTIEGLSRPVIGGPFLGFTPGTILIDMGGNVDSRPDQLLDFGIIGLVYARKWMGIQNPSVALLSNGAEEGKGNEVVKEAYQLFKKSGLNFTGNVEGDDIARGKANVVVCDGFVGNIVGKTCEGLGDVWASWLEDKLGEKLSTAELDAIKREIKQKMNPAESAGGGPLWGLNGVVCKAHGSSSAQQIASTIGAAKKAVEVDLVGSFEKGLKTVKSAINGQ